MKIVEEFLSIQGEGKYQGSISYFIRFGGCNLNCIGFKNSTKSPKTGEILIGCDTIRAVRLDHFTYSDFDLNATILNIKNLKFKPNIVITGGEPLIYFKNEKFYKLVEILLNDGYKIHFETNGTIFIDFKKFPLYKRCTFAISVKLSFARANNCINFDALKNFKDNADFFYKFVLIKGYEKEIFKILDVVNGEVYCMPLGANQKELSKNAKFVFEFCVKNGFNYSDRLHIRIFNDLEGV